VAGESLLPHNLLTFFAGGFIMKRLTYFFVIAAFAALVFAGTASAQISASATAGASARIIKGISLEKTADLEFSEIISNGTGGTVAMPVDGSGAVYTGVKQYPGSKAPQAAKFDVRGEAGKAFSVELPREISILNSNNASMLVNGFKHSAKNSYT